jgi:transcriptional regulator with XRE-family HTH domain
MEIDIGPKIRDLRKKHNLSIKSLAEITDLSTGLISQIERDLVIPSVVVLFKIAKALDVSIGYFFDEDEAYVASPVVRKAERKKIVIDKSNALYELLTPDLNRQIEFLRIVLKGGDSNMDELVSHAGEECGIVLQGTLKIKFKDAEYILEEGDSIAFDCSKPHRYINIGKGECVSIWAMTPPSF